jgi:hypothetical protein
MLNRIQLLCAVTGVLVVLTGGVQARAYEVVDHSGPVEVNDTILETVGSKRVIAFFQRENGRCAVNAVVFEKKDIDKDTTTAARVRVTLRPNEMLSIDTSDNQIVGLQCGSNAKTLTSWIRATS